VFTTNADGENTLSVPVGQPVDMDDVRVYYFQHEAPSGFFRSPTSLRAAVAHPVEFHLNHSSTILDALHLHRSQGLQARRVPWIESPRGAFMTAAIWQRILEEVDLRRWKSAASDH
jgi:hypothetical protein